MSLWWSTKNDLHSRQWHPACRIEQDWVSISAKAKLKVEKKVKSILNLTSFFPDWHLKKIFVLPTSFAEEFKKRFLCTKSRRACDFFPVSSFFITSSTRNAEHIFQLQFFFNFDQRGSFFPKNNSADVMWADQVLGRPGTLFSTAFHEAVSSLGVFLGFCGILFANGGHGTPSKI